MRIRHPPGYTADIKREKAERTDTAAREILDAERQEREAKVAKLKALRLAGERKKDTAN